MITPNISVFVFVLVFISKRNMSFHFDVVKSFLFFVRSRIYVYFDDQLILCFSVVYFEFIVVCNSIGVYCISDLVCVVKNYYIWLAGLCLGEWMNEWFVIGRDGGSDNICTVLFIIGTIVCGALSKDVHLFVLWRHAGGWKAMYTMSLIWVFLSFVE